MNLRPLLPALKVAQCSRTWQPAPAVKSSAAARSIARAASFHGISASRICFPFRACYNRDVQQNYRLQSFTGIQ